MAAEQRAREILRFSPLITDAYFHFTPSQIMLAALSLADRGLAERLIQDTFHYVAPQPSSGTDTPATSGVETPSGASASISLHKRTASPSSGSLEDKAAVIGSHVRDKVLGTIEACRDMLSKELPERREHWNNVCLLRLQFLSGWQQRPLTSLLPSENCLQSSNPTDPEKAQ